MPEVYAYRGILEKMRNPRIGQRVGADGLPGRARMV
jgi:hypothetical protein